ncbi:hypothetical protein [Billgrantia antri]|uniref:hypothetical protein n=1 Tax=Billgrantia antri TaxID=2846777 RepID=UPI003B2240D5
MKTTLNTVRIPESLELHRQPSDNQVLSPEEWAKYDAHTLFYDVFLDQAGKRLVAIGPPANNLASYIASTTLKINGKHQRFKFRDLPDYKLSLLEANVTIHSDCHVEFRFADFSASFLLSRNQNPAGKRILAAISKDNAPEWVATWADFHRYNYAIDEVIVYDNGSKNLNELKDAIRGKAHIIDWKFPYGPPRKRYNKFAQPGALNHCLRKFGKNGVLFNFDIDELLIGDKARLDKELSSSGTVYLDSHNVPLTSSPPTTYTHYDFSLRQPNKRRSARKFICQEKAVAVISQHNTWKNSKIPFVKKFQRCKPEALESQHAYFLHFLPITTNWQPGLGKLDIIDAKGLQREVSHIEKKPTSTDHLQLKVG